MKARMFFADGYEEVEALTVVDILRRAGIECLMVSADDTDTVTGSHGIKVAMDEKISEIDGDCDAVILPGGMRGVANLKGNKGVESYVKAANAKGAWVAAVCAAPTALGAFGILTDKVATCYPGMESQLNSREHSTMPVVIDGHVITSRGLGTSIEFALTIVEKLIDKKTADDLAEKIVYKR